MANSSHPESRSVFPPILAGLFGLALGAAVAGGVFWLLMERQRTRHAAELAEANLALRPLNIGEVPNLMPNPNVPIFDMRGDDESKVRKFGTDFVEDLENNRMQSAYRSMTPDFQMKNKREDFDAMIAENPSVRSLSGVDRSEKVRKGADGQSYEYYLTAVERSDDGRRSKVNFALTIVKVNDEWRIAEWEIVADSKAKKK
jgi:hypothetical protein